MAATVPRSCIYLSGGSHSKRCYFLPQLNVGCLTQLPRGPPDGRHGATQLHLSQQVTFSHFLSSFT